MYTRTYLTEFEAAFDVPAEFIALVAAGRAWDISWHNDTMPCFALTEDESARLWIDHPDPDHREIRDLKRFQIHLYGEDGDFLAVAIETDSLAELLAYIADHYG